MLCFLCWAEIHVDYLDRNEHQDEEVQARCEQIQRFGEIANGIKESIQQSQEQYGNTITHVDGVLKTTQDVAALSKENLEDVTGGKSFAYIVPGTGLREGYPEATGFSLSVFNDGDRMLTGISVIVAGVLQEGNKEMIPVRTDEGPMHPVLMGNLGPHSNDIVPNFMIHPRDFVSNSGHYTITVSAQNGIVWEALYFRRAKSGFGWAYRFNVSRYLSGGKEIKLKKVEWTEPQILKSP